MARQTHLLHNAVSHILTQSLAELLLHSHVTDSRKHSAVYQLAQDHM